MKACMHYISSCMALRLIILNCDQGCYQLVCMFALSDMIVQIVAHGDRILANLAMLIKMFFYIQEQFKLEHNQ